MLRIGNASAFWGDRLSAAAELLRLQPDLDYLTLDYLAELSLSIMAAQREKDPDLGYARDFLDVLEMLPPCKIITNAGGLNPHALAKQIRGKGKVAVVSGDALSIDGAYTANAYLGAAPIVEALERGADIVITGRVADPSLTVAPAVYHYKKKDFDFIAGATVAGHLIECGTQVTGGFSTDWLDVPHPESIGYPIVEIHPDGSCTITKPKGTGGRVTVETVKQQLLYEIGDPERYLSPDATVSFLGLHVEEEGKDRVRVSGAKGGPPPDTYKVSATYKNGYRADATLTFLCPDAKLKAEKTAAVILKRAPVRRSLVECIGSDTECVLHIAAVDPSREALEAFSKEIAPLITSGPQGITGYVGGRAKVRPFFAFKPLAIPRSKVKPEVTLYD